MVNFQRQTDPSKQSLTDDIVISSFHNSGFGFDRYTYTFLIAYIGVTNYNPEEVQ